MRLKQSIFAFVAMLSLTFSAFAQVTTQADLQKALNDGGEVTLGASITVTAPVTIPSSSEVILNLNGETLKATNAKTIVLENSGNLTINGQGTVSGIIYNGKDDKSTAEMTLNGGTYNLDGNNGGIHHYGKTLTINDGVVVKTTSYGVRVSGNNSVLNLNGGTYTATTTGDMSRPFAVTKGTVNFLDKDITVNGYMHVMVGTSKINFGENNENSPFEAYHQGNNYGSSVFYCKTLKEAINRTDFPAITLVKNVKVAQDAPLVVNKNLNLNLNGYNISAPAAKNPVLQNFAVMTIKGKGTVKGAIYNGTSSTKDVAELTLDGGTYQLDGTNGGIFHYGKTLTINDGVTVKTSMYGVRVSNKNSVLNVNGGKFVGSSELFNMQRAITVDAGTVNFNDGDVDYTGVLYANRTNATINFGESNIFDVQYSEPKSAALYYAPKFDAALAYAKAGSTLTLQKNIERSEILTLDKAITLDGNGKTLTSTAGRAINVDCAGEVNISNLIIAASTGCERGINIINKAGTTNINKVNVSGVSHYAVHVATSAGAATVNIENSNLSGWAAVAAYGDGGKVNVKNSNLVGVNTYAKGQNFATIAAASNIAVSVTGGKVTAESFEGKGNQNIVCGDRTGNVTTGASFALDTELELKGTAGYVGVDLDNNTVAVREEYAGNFVTTPGENGLVNLTGASEAEVNGVKYAELEAAFAAAAEGQTITLIADVTPSLTSQRAITKAAVIDLNSKTMTLTEDDLYFGTTTFKNGTIVVDPSVKPSTAVFWMFANQTLTFDNVKIVATGVTGTYLIGLDGNNADLNIINGSEIVVENETALDLDIICVNATTGNDIKVENSKVNVKNLDGRVFFRGNYTVAGNSQINLEGITKAGFRIEAGQTLAIKDNAVVNIIGEPRDGGIHLTDISANYTKAETATVNATVNEIKAIATINGKKFASLQAAVNAVEDGETITLTDNVTGNVTLTEKVGLHYTIDGAGKTMNGSINVASLSDTEDNRRITIKNIKFVDTADANVDFISSVNTNHYPRLTIEGCTFTGSGNDGDVAVRLKSSHSVVIKECTATGLHSFIQNTSGWNLTIENVNVTNSKGAFALGTVQGVTIKGSTIDVATYGIRMDANTYNNNAVIEGNNVTAFIPVVVRKVNAESNVTFTGENTFTAENTDRKWMVIGTTEYEENGKLPAEVATGNVVVALNGANLSYEGVHGAGLAGKGTAEAPYLINNIAELEIFRNSVNAGSAKYSKPGLCIALGADIDMTGVNWVGIGTATADHGFMGNFDGKTFKIKNLTIDNPALDSDGYAYAGLFGVTEGTDKDNQNTIKNLTIENVTINTTGDIVSAAIAYPYYTNVDNVKVCGDIKIQGGKYTAGVLAYTRRCVNASNLSIVGNDGSYVKGTQTVGGVISDIQMNGGLTAVYSNFSAEGITVTGEKSVGGIAGIIATQTLNGATVKNVTLNSTDEFAGVVAGRLGGTSTISNVVAENVTGATAVIGATFDGAKAVEARIGDTYYATLDAALAAEGDEVELFVPVTVAKDETRVLDLKGKTVSHSKACTASYEMIKNLGNLTIKNGTLSFTDTSAGDPSFGWGSYTINNYGTLVVEEGATIQHLGAQEFATHMIAAIQQAKGSTTINGGVISTPNYRSVRINGGALAINGGEFDGQVWLQPNQGDVTIAVNGGTFGPNGRDGSSIFMTNVGENKTVTSASITGGTFTTKIGCSDAAALAGIITGGKFTEAAMTATNGALIGDGFTFDKNAENGYYAVVAGLDGDGTEAAPYMITSVKELELFRESVNNGETKYNAPGVWVALGADIDLANAEWTVGIGDGHNFSFDGNFDGKNHTIKNLNIKPYADADSYICGGLFGYTYGAVTIKNLVIENATVNFATPETGKTYHNVGVLVGFANNKDGKLNVDNVIVKGDIKVDAPQTFGVGAIVGYSYREMGAITNTNVLANAGSYIKGERFVGGITGYSYNNAIIDNCTVENLALTGEIGVGGIAGLALNGNKIARCTVKSVTVNGDKNVAYIVGELGSGNGGNVTVADNCNAPQPWVGGSYATGESFVATIGTQYYTSIAKAVEAAQAGETITLIDNDNVETEEVILLDKSLTINGNGHKVTSNATRVFRVTVANTEVTLNDVNMVNTAVRVGTNDIRGISVDDVTGVKLTLNNCSVDFTDATACDWSYAVNVVGGSGHVVTVNGGTYEGANVINVRGANQTVTVKDAVLTSLYPNNDTYYGACIWVAQNDESSVVATGNTFNGSNAIAFNVGYTPVEESENTDNTTKVVAKIGDAYYTSIQAAVEAAQDGATVKLTQNVTIDELVKLEKAITLDLNDKKVTSTAMKAFEVYANATIKNGTIEAVQRCVDTRKAVELTLTDVTLIADKYTSYGNPQPLTIGGYENGTKVTMTNVNISAADGYGIITFVKTELTATNSTIAGYSALYVKPGSDNSVFNFTKSALSGSNAGNDVEGNSFSTIAVRANNVTVNVDAASTVTAVGNYCDAMSFGGNYAGEESVTDANVTIAGTINGNIMFAGLALNNNVISVKAEYADELATAGFVTSEADATGLVTIKDVTVLNEMTIEHSAYAGLEFVNENEKEVGTLNYVRNFSRTTWQAFYVPFAINYDDIKDDFDVARLNMAHQEEIDGKLQIKIEFISMKDGQTMKANYPYMIRPKQAGAYTFTVKNTTLKKAVSRSIDCSTVDVKFTFTGTYRTIFGDELVDNKYYYMGGGILGFTTNRTYKLNPFNWYMTMEGREDLSDVKFIIGGDFEDEETTGITNIDNDQIKNDGNIYDLQGRRVLHPQKGSLYIVNGKKVVY